MSYKTIEDIRRDYNDGKYSCHITIPSKLPDTHVFDENLTIKQNREMIQEHNHRVDKLKKEKMNKISELSHQLTKDVVDYIMNTYDLNEAQACIVENYVYVEKHSFMCDYFSTIDSVADLAESLIRIQKQKDGS